MTKQRPLGWPQLLALFGIPTLLNGVACLWLIPLFRSELNWPVEIAYFVAVGGFVLAPMLVGALVLSAGDVGSYRPGALLARMRIHRMNGADWLWALVGFLFLGLASFLVAKVFMPITGLDATPFFFENMPLGDEHAYIVYAWPLFFFFNILGEEFLWRGYIQPRQERLNGGATWLVHGLLWAAWHLPMGVDLIIASIPIFFILPAIVQLRKNTSIAIVIHAAFGAFGFLAIAFGAVH